MPAYMITYDPIRTDPSCEKVLGYIKQHAWARISETCYAIACSETAQQVRDALRSLAGANDTFYVVPLRRPHGVCGLPEAPR